MFTEPFNLKWAVIRENILPKAKDSGDREELNSDPECKLLSWIMKSVGKAALISSNLGDEQ